MSEEKKSGGFAGIAAQAKVSAKSAAQMEQARQAQKKQQQARAKQALPKSTRTAVAPPPTANIKAGNPELEAEARSLQSRFERVDRSANLGDIYDDIGNIEELFTNLPSRLSQLRTKGFVHSAHLETRVDDLDDQWDKKVRPQVERQLQTEIQRIDREMNGMHPLLASLAKPNEGSLKMFEMKLDTIDRTVSETVSNLQKLYQGIRQGLSEVDEEVEKAEWMVARLAESPEIKLLKAEAPLMAVGAEWERTGRDDDDPDGILYLTDQRIIFEQNEQKATKKFLFITTASEKVQKLLVDEQVKDIVRIEHKEERRGFSLAQDDLLMLEFGGQAKITRAQFHLKGQDSADWAAVIKLVQTREIDGLRAEPFVAAMEAAAAATASIPEQCPSCLAAIPPQPRGVLSYTCEFCGGVVTAVVPS
jgi:hypothetical protein